jgi:hypothetical protein
MLMMLPADKDVCINENIEAAAITDRLQKLRDRHGLSLSRTDMGSGDRNIFSRRSVTTGSVSK